MASCLALIASSCDTAEVQSIFSSVPEEILFVSPDSTGTSQLFSMNADGGDVRQISHDSDFPIVGAVWSPDGRHIALLSMKGWVKFYGPALYIVDSDGSNLRQLVRGSAPNAASARYPLVWSPDSRRMAFRRLLVPEALGTFETFITDTEGNRLTPVSEETVSETISDWKGDDTTLLGYVDGVAYDSMGRRIDHRHLLTWSLLDGTPTKLLGDPGEGLASPKWSPDETHIVFTLFRDRDENLAIADSDGSNMRVLTNREFEFITPVAWSRSGTILARGYTKNSAGDWIGRVALVDAETGAVSDASPFPDVENLPCRWLGND